MSKILKITFGPEDKTVEGKIVEHEEERHLAILRDAYLLKGVNPQTVSKHTWNAEREKIESQRTGEKNILIMLLENSLNFNKEVGVFNQVLDCIGTIENSSGSNR